MFQSFWTPKRIKILIEEYGEKEAEFLKKNRFQYAWKLACVAWGHRERYSKKRTGNCETCKLKHC